LLIYSLVTITFVFGDEESSASPEETSEEEAGGDAAPPDLAMNPVNQVQQKLNHMLE